MSEKLSTYKTFNSSNYTSTDDIRKSPSYPVTKRISSPGKSKNDFLFFRVIPFIELLIKT